LAGGGGGGAGGIQIFFSQGTMLKSHTHTHTPTPTNSSLIISPFHQYTKHV
jgi:hypothetical protein